MLTWRTESEFNNRGFELQRSKDGKNFIVVSWVNGQGTTVIPHDYKYVDRRIEQNNTYYYRLKQIDYDGEFEYSELVVLTYDDNKSIEIKDIYPNPLRDRLANLEVTVQKSSNAQIVILDAVGKSLFKLNVSLKSGKNLLKLDLSDAPNGTYFVQVDLGSGVTQSKQLMVAR